MQILRSDSAVALIVSPARIDLYADLMGPGQSRPTRLSSVMSRGYAAALNGPMFGICQGSPSSYAGATCNTLDFLHYRSSQGLIAPSAGAREGITLSIVRDWFSVQAVMQDAPDPRAHVAVQLYPSLVENGRDVTNPSLNIESQWRSGVGVDRRGNVMLVAGTGSMTAFARKLISLGAVNAGYTDGGGSTSLGWRGGRQGSSEDRPVGSWIVVRNLPILPKVGVLGGTAALAYGGWWASKKYKKQIRRYLP